MLSFYQHLPENISPIAVSVGFFSVYWYSVAYLVGFAVVYRLLRYRILQGEDKSLNPNFNPPAGGQISNKIQNPKYQMLGLIFDWMSYSILGLLVGGRLGYVLFYNFGYYLQNPVAIISPYDFSVGIWTGILGMSYFGGVMGIIVASYIFTKKNKIDFWSWADWVVPAIPAGYFFGRIGNFWNGELFGRITEKPWGMYFPADFGLVLRHPSQLYEAFFEGLVLFVILWRRRNKIKFPGQLLVTYLFCYGFFRFGIEFFREPDNGAALFLGFLTLGQIFSLGFVVLALILWSTLSKRGKAL